jgi:5-methylcytosine-specific restriction endonuclease McrA
LTDRRRSTSAAKYRRLYKTALWQTLRAQILTRDLYTCQRCGCRLTQGRSRPTDAVVNHITPHKGSVDLFSDPDNLEAVCKQCHDSRIQGEERGTTIGPDGWAVD